MSAESPSRASLVENIRSRESSSDCRPAARSVTMALSRSSLESPSATGAALDSDFIWRATFLSSGSKPSGTYPDRRASMFSSEKKALDIWATGWLWSEGAPGYLFSGLP